jgi:DNA polymerase III alpha subunit (gram-positive type)
VSHNAPFDIGFLNAIRQSGSEPPSQSRHRYLGSLPLSFPGCRQAHLGALSRNLNLEVYDEEDAHRADYDAEALNNVWQVIIPILTKDEEHLDPSGFGFALVRRARTFSSIFELPRMVAIAKNQAGHQRPLSSYFRLPDPLSRGGSTPKIPREELQQYRRIFSLVQRLLQWRDFRNRFEQERGRTQESDALLRLHRSAALGELLLAREYGGAYPRPLDDDLEELGLDGG